MIGRHAGVVFVATVLFASPVVAQAPGDPIRGEPIVELRRDAARLAANAGTACAPWTDDPIVPGATPVRAVHLTEIRACLDQALGVDLSAHVTVLRAVIEESSASYYRVKGTLLNDGTRNLTGFSRITARVFGVGGLLLAEDGDYLALSAGNFFVGTQRTFDILVDRDEVSGWQYFTLAVFDDDRNPVRCSGCAMRRR